MKKIYLFLIFTLYYSLFTTNIYAVTLPTETSTITKPVEKTASSVISAVSTPSPVSRVEQQIDELKDRIASRVAELNLVEKRGIIGTVTDVSGTQITLNDIKDDTRFVDVDELTKFTGAPNDSDSFGISDIQKDSTLAVLGLYNKQSRRILARTVNVVTLPKIIHGSVATIDSDSFILNIATNKNEQLQVEVETTTKTFSYERKSEELTRAGFSKISEGMSIFAVGFPDKQDENLIIADRIIIFPDIIKSPTVETVPIIPSTGSGKKLTPITQ